MPKDQQSHGTLCSFPLKREMRQIYFPFFPVLRSRSFTSTVQSFAGQEQSPPPRLNYSSQHISLSDLLWQYPGQLHREPRSTIKTPVLLPLLLFLCVFSYLLIVVFCCSTTPRKQPRQPANSWQPHLSFFSPDA